MWLGDFNCHHPYWDSVADFRLFTPTSLTVAELLIQHVADWDLIMTLPALMPTHEHLVTKKKTRLNNIFCTPHTSDLIFQCETLILDPKPGMDHFPIVTVIKLPLPCLIDPSRLNFHDMDWTAFASELHIRLLD